MYRVSKVSRETHGSTGSWFFSIYGALKLSLFLHTLERCPERFSKITFLITQVKIDDTLGLGLTFLPITAK